MNRLAVISGLAAVSLAARLASAGPLPQLPDPNAPPPPQSAPPSAAPSPDHALSTIDHARRGVVSVENANGFLGVGTVLAGDGRVLTALSGLRGAEDAIIRYADGSTARAKVVHRDKAWDLALLAPASGKWLDGLLASEMDPSRAAVAFVGRDVHAKAAALSPLPVTLKSKQDVKAKTGETLPGALDFDLRGVNPLAGAPVLDTKGDVLGVFVLACKANVTPPPGAPIPPPGHPGACAPIAVAAPVAALRHFLGHAPAVAPAPSPWLGIRGESEASGVVRGVRVLAVASGSPAEKGGLKAPSEKPKNAGDLIVAVDGVPVDSPEKLSEAIGKHAVGDTVKLIVFNGTFREAQIKLQAAPPS